MESPTTPQPQQPAPKIELTTSRMFAGWLAAQRASLALTTYQTGKIFLIGLQPNGRLSVFERTLDDSSTTEVRAEYEFNGLNWRTIKRADTATPFDGVLDQQRIMYYSSGWQLLEERIDDDFASGPSIDRHVQYVWGPRYIDDVVLPARTWISTATRTHGTT